MHFNNKKNKTIILGILLILFVSCSEKKEVNSIVRVGDFHLTESMIESDIGTNNENKMFREEYIRGWVENKLLYLSAIDKGILKSTEYIKIIDEAKVDIANAFVINRLIEENSKDISDLELEKYYVENISEFRLGVKAFLYNQVTFNNKNVARKFRRKLVSNCWEKVVTDFSNNDALIFSKKNSLEYIYNVSPVSIKTELSNLKENGISGVVETSKNIFTILQLIKSYEKDDVPEFNEIETNIRKKQLAKKRKEIYNNYVKQLYIEYSSEIER